MNSGRPLSFLINPNSQHCQILLSKDDGRSFLGPQSDYVVFRGGGHLPPPPHPPPTASDDCRNKGPTENVLLAAGILKIFALRTFEFTYFWITRLDFGQARKAVTRQLLFGSTQVRSTFQIINILASQTLLLSLLFVRAIRFSTGPQSGPVVRKA